MSKSTNTVVYFDWKTVIYIYVCGQCRTQFKLSNSGKSVASTAACAKSIHIPYDGHNCIFSNPNRMSFFRFVNKQAIYRLGIISLAHAPVYVTDFPVLNVHVDELIHTSCKWEFISC
jgi:hypothetical protein